MSWDSLKRLLLTALGTFAAIATAGLVLILLLAPTITPYRLVAFITAMFAVSGAVLGMVICIHTSKRR